jgi:serine/threonine protein kinase
MANKLSKQTNSNTDTDTDTESESESEYINWSGKIINSRYLIMNKIGKGSYCSVWNVYDIKEKKYIGFKIYNNDDTDDAKYEKKIMDELKKLNIKDIVLYNKSFVYEYNSYEYIIDIIPLYGYSLNDIRHLLRDNLNLINCEKDKKIYNNYINFLVKVKNNLLTILEKLHKNEYIHTDIKPENILIDKPRVDTLILFEQIKNKHIEYIELKKKFKFSNILEELSKYTLHIIENLSISNMDVIKYIEDFNFNIKLCDMGTSLKCDSSEIYKKHTSYYKSPMIILKYPLNYDYDYWSFACTLYELITFNLLFDPFDENLLEKYDDIEDFNLLYLIISTIGMPSCDIINNSPVKDIFFTFDIKTLRFYDEFICKEFINDIMFYNDDNNKNDMIVLLQFIINNLKYK